MTRTNCGVDHHRHAKTLKPHIGWALFAMWLVSGCTCNLGSRPIGREDPVVAVGTLIESRDDLGMATYSISQVVHGQMTSSNIDVLFFSRHERAAKLPMKAILILTRNHPLRSSSEKPRAGEYSPQPHVMHAIGWDAATAILPYDEATKRSVVKDLWRLVETPPRNRLSEETAIGIAQDYAAKAGWRPSSPYTGHRESRYTHGWIVFLYGHNGDNQEELSGGFEVFVDDDGRVKGALRHLM